MSFVFFLFHPITFSGTHFRMESGCSCFCAAFKHGMISDVFDTILHLGMVLALSYIGFDFDIISFCFILQYTYLPGCGPDLVESSYPRYALLSPYAEIHHTISNTDSRADNGLLLVN